MSWVDRAVPHRCHAHQATRSSDTHTLPYATMNGVSSRRECYRSPLPPLPPGLVHHLPGKTVSPDLYGSAFANNGHRTTSVFLQASILYHLSRSRACNRTCSHSSIQQASGSPLITDSGTFALDFPTYRRNENTHQR